MLTSVSTEDNTQARGLEDQWAEWNPGPLLRVLQTEYASVAGPILAFVDQFSKHHREQVVVLIPVAQPERPWYRILHNHLDQALSHALRSRPDVVIVRVPMPLHLADGEPQARPGA